MTQRKQAQIVRSLDADIIDVLDNIGNDEDSKVQSAKELFDLALRRRGDRVGVMTVEQTLFERLVGIFSDECFNIFLRRGAGVLLIELVKQRPETSSQISCMSEALRASIGGMFLESPIELKWLAGGFIRAAITQGVDVLSFWAGDPPTVIDDRIPSFQEVDWNAEFAEFIKHKGELLGFCGEPSYRADYLESRNQGNTNMTKSDGSLFVESDRITFLQWDHPAGYEFVDIPIDERIASTKVLSQSQNGLVSQLPAPKILEISIHGALWALMDNCAQKPAELVRLSFSELRAAKAVQQAIMKQVEALPVVIEGETDDAATLTPFPSRHRSAVLVASPKRTDGNEPLSDAGADDPTEDVFYNHAVDIPSQSLPHATTQNELHDTRSNTKKRSQVTTEFNFTLPGLQEENNVQPKVNGTEPTPKSGSEEQAMSQNLAEPNAFNKSANTEKGSLTTPRNVTSVARDFVVDADESDVDVLSQTPPSAQPPILHNGNDLQKLPATHRQPTASKNQQIGESDRELDSVPNPSSRPVAAKTQVERLTRSKLRKPLTNVETNMQTPNTAKKLRDQMKAASTQYTKPGNLRLNALPLNVQPHTSKKVDTIIPPDTDQAKDLFDIDTVLEKEDDKGTNSRGAGKKKKPKPSHSQTNTTRARATSNKKTSKTSVAKTYPQPLNRQRKQPSREATKNALYKDNADPGLSVQTNTDHYEAGLELIDEESARKPSVIQFTPKGPKNQGKGAKPSAIRSTNLAVKQQSRSARPAANKQPKLIHHMLEQDHPVEQSAEPNLSKPDVGLVGKAKTAIPPSKPEIKSSKRCVNAIHDATPPAKRIRNEIPETAKEKMNGLSSFEPKDRLPESFKQNLAEANLPGAEMTTEPSEDGEFMQIDEQADGIPQGSQLSSVVDINGSPHPRGTIFDIQRNPNKSTQVEQRLRPEAAIRPAVITRSHLQLIPIVEGAKPKQTHASQKGLSKPVDLKAMDEHDGDTISKLLNALADKQAQDQASHVDDAVVKSIRQEHNDRELRVESRPESAISTYSGVAVASPDAKARARVIPDIIDLTKMPSSPLRPESDDSSLHDRSSQDQEPPVVIEPPVVSRFLDRLEARYPHHAVIPDSKAQDLAWNEADETLIGADEGVTSDVGLKLMPSSYETSERHLHALADTYENIPSTSSSDEASDMGVSIQSPEAGTKGVEAYEMEELYTPHQLALLDVLMRTSRDLVSHLADCEASMSRKCKLFIEGAKSLVCDMETAHQNEIDQYVEYGQRQSRMLGEELQNASIMLAADFSEARELRKQLVSLKNAESSRTANLTRDAESLLQICSAVAHAA